MDEEFKPNSHKYKESLKKEDSSERKLVKKAIKGTVKTKEKSEAHKFLDIFIADDIRNVKDYLIQDVVIPTIRNAIVETITEGVTRLFGVNKPKDSSFINATRVSYRDYSSPEKHRVSSVKPRSDYYENNIILDNIRDAEEVLFRMEEMISMYGFVSVADLHDLIGKTSPYTANRYGWTSVRSVKPVRVREGYLLRFPKPYPID